MISEKELAEMEALANSTTEAPWYPSFGLMKVRGESEIGPSRFYVASIDTRKVVAFCGFTQDDDNLVKSVADSRFIANARTDVPRLIAEIRYLQDRLDDNVRIADGFARECYSLRRKISDMALGCEVDEADLPRSPAENPV